MDDKLSNLPLNLTDSLSESLKEYTYARIQLKNVGHSVSMKEILKFKEDHALAKDAVWAPFQADVLSETLSDLGIENFQICANIENRNQYLQRPDLGKLLSLDSHKILNDFSGNFDLCIIVCDGLSATALNLHIVDLIGYLLPSLNKFNYLIAPMVILKNGRVAAGDIIGEKLGAKLTLMLIGERPGLSSHDSIGAYITYGPKEGLKDDARNCVSNIRPRGMDFLSATMKITYLINEAMNRKLSGVNLKDESGNILN